MTKTEVSLLVNETIGELITQAEERFAEVRKRITTKGELPGDQEYKADYVSKLIGMLDVQIAIQRKLAKRIEFQGEET